jgi:glycosyltransferase involved in cell wall biosynthesis
MINENRFSRVTSREDIVHKMKKICFIYEYLTSYIIPLIEGMSENVSVDFIYSSISTDNGFGKFDHRDSNKLRWIEVATLYPFGKKIGMYQKGLVGHIIRTRPDAVIIFANPRYISFWFIVILGRILKIPIYPRGQGLYKKPKVGIIHKLMYSLILRLGVKYLCYTPSVYYSLLPYAPNEQALGMGYNTLYNSSPIPPTGKKGDEDGVFFIGRLRERSGIEILIQAIEYLHDKGYKNIKLHVIGGGKQSDLLKQKSQEHLWLFYHGMIFDEGQISNISKNCRLGCYAGDAGLSIVHMMSLSLPPLTHQNLAKHMGPEPSYIDHRTNGWLYEPELSVEGLAVAIEELWLLPKEDMKILQSNAFTTYQQLNDPPFHKRMLELIDQYDDKNMLKVKVRSRRLLKK